MLCVRSMNNSSAGRKYFFYETNYAESLSSKIIESWFNTMSQFRHLCVHLSTIFCDAKYSILRRLSSFVKDGLFFVICLNCLFRPSMMFVVYIILRTSGGYAKKVDNISQFSSQLFTQDRSFYEVTHCFRYIFLCYYF